MRGICLQFLLCLGTLHAVMAQGGGYKVQFSPAAPGRQQGNVLVLDVSSLWQKHPAEPSISTQDASECQLRCSKLPGCTAWTFCKDPKGCGTGCSAYVGQNPAVSAITLEGQTATKRGERVENPNIYKLPLTRFGPYTPNTKTKGCHPDTPDKWAFGTCTLLRAVGPREVAPGAASTGWVSALLTAPVPQQCAGLSAAACAACSSSPDPASCISCMTDKRATSYVESISLVGDHVPRESVGGRTLDQCLSCVKMTDKAAQKKCMSCVLDRQPCASCIPYPGLNIQLTTAAQGSCMGCVEARGKRFTGSCLTCSSSADPGKCLKCLDTFYPKMTCTTAEYKDCYKPDFDNPCATCQKVAASNYDTCISCFSSPKQRVDCESCSALGSPTAQSQCFGCTSKVPALNSETPGGCGLCYTQSKNAAVLSQCVTCLTDAGTTADKRRFCSLCSSSQLSGDQSAQCFKCLEGSSGSTGCSSCSTAASSPAAVNSCMACHNSKVNGPDCRDCSNLGSSLAPAARDALRKRCWDCVVASKLELYPEAGSASLGSCQACFAGDPANLNECVSCNTNPLVSSVAKSWCVACALKPSNARGGCIKCLSSNKLPNTYGYKDKCSI